MEHGNSVKPRVILSEGGEWVIPGDGIGKEVVLEAVLHSIEEVTSGKILTRDLGGQVSTKEFTDSVLENLITE